MHPSSTSVQSRPNRFTVARLSRLLSVGLIGLPGVVFAMSSRAAESADKAEEAFGTLVRAAYSESPELRAAHARWQAARHRVPQAEALPDPTVSYGYFVESAMTRQQLRVEQMFPGFGKRGARRSVAEAEAEAAAKALETAAADLRLNVLNAGTGYLLAVHSVELVEENLRLVESVADFANRRQRTGGTSQADILRLENEAELLRLELQSWRERIPSQRARLNALLGRPAEAPLPELDAVAGLPALPESIPEDLHMRLEENPDMRQAEAGVRRAEQAERLARRESRPDIILGVEYMESRDGAPNEVMGMVSLSIPLWQGNYRAARREAAAELRAAEAEYNARLDRLESESWRTLYALRDAVRRVRLFENSLLPRAHQTLAIVESGYRTGANDFIELQDAQRAVLDLQLDSVQAQADAFIRAAEWKRLTLSGMPVPEISIEAQSR